MSASPDAMATLLASSLSQPSQGGIYGGGNMGPQVQAQVNPLAAAGDIAQKVMLMRALQQPRQPTAPPIQPQPNQIGSINAIPQQMNQQPVPGGSNA